MGSFAWVNTIRVCGAKVEQIRVIGRGEPEPYHEPMRHMTEEEIHAAAVSDPDTRPMTEAELRNARRVKRVKTIRRALQFTQEEFAARFHIPLGTEARLGARTQ